MRRSRFTEGQILGILKEHEAGRSAADLCRKHGISDQTLYNWKAKYGGREPAPEEAAGRGGDGQLGASGTAEKKLIGPAARFGAVDRVMREHGYSERAACRLIGVDRSAFRYERVDGGGAALRKRLRELAGQRRRFGYRRLAILLRREGAAVNLKRIWRLYREERLAVAGIASLRSMVQARAPMTVPLARSINTARFISRVRSIASPGFWTSCAATSATTGRPPMVTVI